MNTRAIAICSALLLSITANAQTPQTGDQDITVTGPARITVDGRGVTVTPATQPAGGKPTTQPGQVRIRMSGNNFGNNGPGNPTPLPAIEAGQATDNPFKVIKPEGAALLKKRGIDIAAVQKMKAVVITGNFQGASRREIVNDDPNLVVILGKGFKTHGSVTSKGPILATDDAHFMGAVKGESIVWFTGESYPRGETAGSPVICGPSAQIRQAKWVGEEVWIGKYGME